MIEQLEAHDRKPEILYADGQYGSDANVVEAAQHGVDLQSPVAGAPQQNPDDLTIDDFVVGEETQTVECCPNGHEPVSSVHDPDKGRTRTVMDASHCSACPCRNQCPVKQVRGEYVIEHSPAEHRLASRRAEQATEAFREHYAIRGGGESVNAGLKRKTGMGRLRVRGSPRVRMAVLLRCAGWNLFRALAAMKQRGIAGFGAFFAAWASRRNKLNDLTEKSLMHSGLGAENRSDCSRATPWALIRTLARRFGRRINASDGFGSHQTAFGRQSPMLATA